MSIAYLFPGQGAQFVGMGKDIAEQFPAAKAIFEKANEIAGFDLTKICFEGPAEKLNTTTMSQPAIFTVSAAILEVMRTTTALKPDVTAGLSMGEYTALHAAALISFEDGLLLVKKRGEAMQAAADASSGGMVAIIGLDEQKSRALCQEAACGELVEPVNFNCPGQIALSGAKSACERAQNLAEKYGAIKAVRLEVAGAFHTVMMSPAGEALGEQLAKTKIAEPATVKTIANINAEYYASAAQIRDGLRKQLAQPIYWQKCVERLLADGIETFYEIGPGKVLTGLMRRVNRKANIINISSADEVKSLGI
ncbi:MAG: ACP S-malonyltransferase [Sedimentisphaerales bacterium]|nr:ACP S-malonyltransferase [Sedimentisphaerales bacterium]